MVGNSVLFNSTSFNYLCSGQQTEQENRLDLCVTEELRDTGWEFDNKNVNNGL